MVERSSRRQAVAIQKLIHQSAVNRAEGALADAKNLPQPVEPPVQRERADKSPKIGQIGHYALGDRKAGDYLSPENLEKLYEGTSNEKKTEAREAFLNYLHHHEVPPGEASSIDLKSLIGEEGVKLYKAAIKEELDSKAFREAVFLNSTKHYPGETCNKKFILWVAGPSSSGKTRGAEEAVQKIIDLIPKTDEASATAGNRVTSVDGGVDREVCQIRKMMVNYATDNGYSDVSDAHKNTKLGAKKYVKEAAIAQAGLNVVIPETFSDSFKIDKNNIKESVQNVLYKKEMKKYENDPGIVQAFSEIVAPPGKEDQFEQTVGRLGNARAKATQEMIDKRRNDREKSGKSMLTEDLNEKPLCESKEYEGGSKFKFGCQFSKWARENYQTISKDPIYIPITNDLIFIKKEENQWRPCQKGEAYDFGPITERDFNRFQLEQKMLSQQIEVATKHMRKLPRDQKNTKETLFETINKAREKIIHPKQWLANQIKEGNNAPPLIEVIRNNPEQKASQRGSADAGKKEKPTRPVSASGMFSSFKRDKEINLSQKPSTWSKGTAPKVDTTEQGQNNASPDSKRKSKPR